MNLDRIICALSILGLAVMAGCAGVEWTTMQLESDSKQYAQPLTMKKNRVTITVYWKTLEEIQKICGPMANACALPIDSEAECTVFTEKPRSWNNAPLQKRLGHEILHCLGGTHE